MSEQFILFLHLLTKRKNKRSFEKLQQFEKLLQFSAFAAFSAAKPPLPPHMPASLPGPSSPLPTPPSPARSIPVMPCPRRSPLCALELFMSLFLFLPLSQEKKR